MALSICPNVRQSKESNLFYFSIPINNKFHWVNTSWANTGYCGTAQRALTELRRCSTGWVGQSLSLLGQSTDSYYLLSNHHHPQSCYLYICI